MRRGQIIGVAAKPKPPFRLRYGRRGGETIVVGHMRLTPDIAIRVGATLNDRLLARYLEEIEQDPELIGGFFEDVGDGLSDAWEGVKDVAKKVVNSDVLRKVANTLTDPRFQALVSVVPGLGPMVAQGTAQVGAAWNGLRAATASAKGFGELAQNISQSSAMQAAGLGVPPAAFNAAQAFGASLAVNPEQLAVIEQQVPGGLRSLMRSYSAPPIPQPAHMPAAGIPSQAVASGPLVNGPPLTPRQVHQIAQPVAQPAPPAAPSRVVIPRPPPKPTVVHTQPKKKPTAADLKRITNIFRLVLGQNFNASYWGLAGVPSQVVIDYQRKVGIPQTGKVDSMTRLVANKAGVPLSKPPSTAAPLPTSTPQALQRGVSYISPDQAKWLATAKTYTEKLKGPPADDKGRRTYGAWATWLRTILLNNRSNPGTWGAYGPSWPLVHYQRAMRLPVTGLWDANTINRFQSAQVGKAPISPGFTL